MAKNVWSVVTAVVAFTVIGCTSTERVTEPTESPLVRAVRQLGFSPVGMVDYGERIVVEGDIVLDKAELLEAARDSRKPADTPRTASGPRFQWAADTLVGSNSVSAIRVDLSAISGNSFFVSAMRQAMANWNALPGTTVTFTEASPGDITVRFYSDYWCSYVNGSIVSVGAQANLPIGPSGGKPGPNLWINQNSLNGGCATLSNAQAVFMLTHELGHSIGFRHTNWQGKEAKYSSYTDADGVTRYTDGANQISGTPQTDGASVMNGGSLFTSWTGFSAYDSTAAMQLYSIPLDFSVSNSGGYALLSWQAQRGAQSIHLYETTDYREVDDSYQWHDTYSSDWGDYPWVATTSDLTSDLYTGYSYCSSPSNFPYPEQYTYFTIDVTFPRGIVRSASVSAPIQSPTGWEGC